MNEVILKIENLSKQYRLGTVGTGTISHDLNRWWHTVRGKEDPFLKIGDVNDRSTKATSEYVWALKDINFEVKKGEVLGIIGKNGAGKSTLLKILSKVTGPTTGSIKSKGRIASLLEVGTGFHPELTGRENIYLNGAILGMTKAEINAKLDEIIEFSGCERYIDTPTKRYSSGMTVRLAFAVAAFLEPDILVIDEVLAVGDAEFQKKAIGKMQDISKGEGRTVLFVSHNMQAISVLTNKCIVMNNGGIFFEGKTNDAITRYLSLDSHLSDNIYKAIPLPNKSSITKVKLITSLPNNVQRNNDLFEIHIQIFMPYLLEKPAVAIQAINSNETPILYCWNFDEQISFGKKSGYYNLICRIPQLKLYMGKYNLTVHYADNNGKNKLETLKDICPFEVVMFGVKHPYKWELGTCTYIEDAEWNINYSKEF
ncbi:lipopolysaccharide transport system ATP-binding protein [Lutibacter agarilyticus]|uniref:Lipopolysaccharide transport system ATP-binding protein n=1 Tax=Lutibacter agarilyticus TaxID=1109740 RepID=A0A238YYM6_9FLAO|nr:ABC transporter ATP-binding protein [Lutibacter agarilyticus]SNR76225.1 lipopolysaccharide transport system ATP-binding protein [Lutibacter agarilyticus]